MVLIVPPDWQLSTSGADWRSVLDARQVVSYDECDFVFAEWFAATIGDPRRTLRSGDHYSELEEVVQAVAAGRGFSIVPLDVVTGLTSTAPVDVVRTRPVVRNPVYAVVRADRPDAAAFLFT